MELFIKGLVIGFGIAAPVGPIGILCIRRTLTGGHLAGFVSGLGAAAADAFYGFVAAFGLTLVGNVLTQHVRGLTLAGGILLIYLGVAEWRATPPDPAAVPTTNPIGLIRNFTSTLLLTLTNPMTIASFAAIFAGFGLVGPAGAVDAAQRDYLDIAVLVGGVFLGSSAWWLTLSTGVGMIRHRLDTPTLVWLNRIAGTLVGGFGCYVLWQAFR